MRFAVAILLAFATAAPARGADVPLERIRDSINRMVERILPCQQENGAFILGTPQGPDAGLYSQFPQGQTALAVMALQYARPHLDGDLQTRGLEAIRKGIAHIAQRPPEPRTYSAGVIITILYQENPERYRKLIDAYATMLATSQHDSGETSGEWGYRLATLPNAPPPRVTVDSWGDKSNTQFALLGLYNAQRSGFQVPKIVWQRSAEHYLKSQFIDGGWGYMPQLRPQPYANMTVAGTISLQLCEEMLFAEGHKQCKPPPRSKAVDGGLKWIADNWNKSDIGVDPYGLYALERLGILMGRSNVGGHDWYNEGAFTFLGAKQISAWGTLEAAYCFGVAFLARGLEPIVINKLERADTQDWNNDPYDIKHLTEYLQDRHQLAVQWRIVTLEAPIELLVRTPILYVSGHAKQDFDDAEKQKLKAYVEGGGTILAQACCSSKTFDASIRALAKEMYGAEFQPFPKGSRIFERMQTKGIAPNPELLYVALESHQGRPVIIYLPHDYGCRWHSGGNSARESFAVGAGIYFFVVNEGQKMYEATHPKPPAPPTPEPPKPTEPPTELPDQPKPPREEPPPDMPDNPLIPKNLPPGF